MNQSQPMTRLEVVDVETLEVKKAVYLAGHNAQEIQAMSDSLLRNLNTFQFFVRAKPSAAPVAATAHKAAVDLSSLTRFDKNLSYLGLGRMENHGLIEAPAGDYVRFDDVKALVIAPSAPVVEGGVATDERNCDSAFDHWYAAQSHQLTNEQLCRLIWQRGWQASVAAQAGQLAPAAQKAV